MDSVSAVPSLSMTYILHLLVNYIVVPLLLCQGALLHPYYEPDPHYRKIRAWLAPLTIFFAIYSQKRRLFQPIEDYMHINYAVVAVPTFHIICVALQYAKHRGPARKIDENKHKKYDSGSSSDPDSDNSSSITNSDSQQVSETLIQHPKVSEREKKINKSSISPKPTAPGYGELARFSIWMTSSPRSLGYVWGPPANILSPAPKRTMTRFLLREFFKMFIDQVGMIAYCAIALPSTAHPERIYGWLNQYITLPDNRLVRYVARKFLVAPWGGAGMHAFNMVGGFFTIWELVWITGTRLILPKSSSWRPEPFDTTQYPDLFSKPALRTSLTDFWGKGWQSVFRRDFIFCGAEPFAKFFAPYGVVYSRLAGLLGAMLISGFLHEWGLISTAKEIDWSFRTTTFFVLIAVGIGFEHIFKHITGRRVGGLLGWIWLWCWFGIWSEMFIAPWFERGVGLAGMSGPYNVNEWPLAKFLVPLGPLLPDEVITKFAAVFTAISSWF